MVMGSNTLAMVSKCFSIASLMSTHFHPELDPIITTLHEFDFVVMNQQHEDISVIFYHTCTILT